MRGGERKERKERRRRDAQGCLLKEGLAKDLEKRREARGGGVFPEKSLSSIFTGIRRKWRKRKKKWEFPPLIFSPIVFFSSSFLSSLQRLQAQARMRA